MFKFLLILILVVLIALVFGVRFHPEAIPDYFKDDSTRTYREIKLKSGQSFIGEVVGESEGTVHVEVEGGSMAFSQKEISSISPVSARELSALTKKGLVMKAPKRPLWTYNPKQCVFNRTSAGKETAPVPAGVQGGTVSGSGSLQDMQSAMAGAMVQAYQYQAMADQKNREIERQVREMEEGGPSSRESSGSGGGSYRFSLKGNDD